jgi:hypothetical protein
MIVANRIVFKAFPAFIRVDDKGNDFFEGLLSSCSPNDSEVRAWSAVPEINEVIPVDTGQLKIRPVAKGRLQPA